jgi:hypothetical protein
MSTTSTNAPARVIATTAKTMIVPALSDQRRPGTSSAAATKTTRLNSPMKIRCWSVAFEVATATAGRRTVTAATVPATTQDFFLAMRMAQSAITTKPARVRGIASARKPTTNRNWR